MGDERVFIFEKRREKMSLELNNITGSYFEILPVFDERIKDDRKQNVRQYIFSQIFARLGEYDLSVTASVSQAFWEVTECTRGVRKYENENGFTVSSGKADFKHANNYVEIIKNLCDELWKIGFQEVNKKVEAHLISIFGTFDGRRKKQFVEIQKNGSLIKGYKFKDSEQDYDFEIQQEFVIVNKCIVVKGWYIERKMHRDYSLEENMFMNQAQKYLDKEYESRYQDTLKNIAQHFHTTVKDLLANDFDTSDVKKRENA